MHYRLRSRHTIIALGYDGGRQKYALESKDFPDLKLCNE